MKTFLHILFNFLFTSDRPRRTVGQVAARKIPSEIWELVAQYLAPKDIWNLRILNSTFLSLALDIRYESAHLARGCKSVYAFQKQLKRLRDPFISHHVRSLIIKSDAHIGNVTTSPGWLNCIRSYEVGSYAEQERVASSWVAWYLRKQVRNTVEQLSSVISLTVLYEPISSSYMDVVWRKFSHNIISLTLHFGEMGCRHILALDSSVKCPNVRSFSLYCSSEPENTARCSIDKTGCPRLFHDSGMGCLDPLYEKAATKILLMLPQGLKELHLNGYPAHEYHSTVLLRPENFPRLTSFSCSTHALWHPHGLVLAGFVEAHSLKSLSCDACEGLNLRSFHLDGIQNLSVNARIFFQDPTENLRVFPPLDLGSLQRLQINWPRYQGVLSQFDALFDSPLASTCNLRDLSVSFPFSVNLHFLMKVAEHLPHLHTLILADVRGVGPGLAESCDPFGKLHDSIQLPKKRISATFSGIHKLEGLHSFADYRAVLEAFSRILFIDIMDTN